jgi:hypothetical protein
MPKYWNVFDSESMFGPIHCLRVCFAKIQISVFKLVTYKDFLHQKSRAFFHVSPSTTKITTFTYSCHCILLTEYCVRVLQYKILSRTTNPPYLGYNCGSERTALSCAYTATPCSWCAWEIWGCGFSLPWHVEWWSAEASNALGKACISSKEQYRHCNS